MSEAKEEVRARLAIEEVVGEYVQLKRAGRNFKGLSPFSGEKTPSFFVSPEKQIWHDFSSNRGGDVFSFVMEAEGMDFRQALEHLARKAGIELSDYEPKGAKERSQRKARAVKANALAAQYYQHSLLKNPHALEYVFKKRALSKAMVESFQIGYAPQDGQALVQFMTKKGFSKQELSDAGLVNRFGGDLFRGRMTVALHDPSGQVIGFTARILADEPNAPKYLNTPQTILYDKSRHVFGLSQAKQAIRTQDYVVMVEGNLDVISSHQVGQLAVIATAGTALTEHHLRALKRLTPHIKLAFDADKAGLAATERAIGIASALDIELSVVSLPGDFKDPDELIQQDSDAWNQAIADSKPAVDWLLERYATLHDTTTARGKRSYTASAMAVIGQLSSSVEREHYEQIVAAVTHSSLEAVQATKPADEPQRQLLQVASPSVQPRDPYAHEDALLSLLLIDAASQDLMKQRNIEIFHGEERQLVARFLQEHSGKSHQDTPKALHSADTYVKILLLKAEARYASWDTQQRYFEAAELLRRCETEYTRHKKTVLQTELRQAEQEGDEVASQTLLAQITLLDKELSSGQR